MKYSLLGQPAPRMSTCYKIIDSPSTQLQCVKIKRNSAKRHLLGAAVDMQLKHFLNSSGLKKQNIFFEIIYPDHNRVPISMRIFLFIYLHYFTLFMYASAATLILLLFIASCFINYHIPAAVHGDIRNMFCLVFLLLRVRDYSSQNK